MVCVQQKRCGHPEGVTPGAFRIPGVRLQVLVLLSDGIRESSSADLLSLVVELGGEGEGLRSVRDSHQQAEMWDLRNGGEWKGVLFGVAGESTPNLPHLPMCLYIVGMRPWNPRPKK